VKLLTLLLLLGSASSWAQDKLLDKIVAVINTRVISLSELNRVQDTLDARREVSGIIYTEKEYTPKKLLDILLRGYIIRDKINAQGYVINDDAVESRIKMTEERLGLRRADLLNFLKQKNLTYEEYFELIRETMEYNVFASRIIAPLITVTEQEVKNNFYKRQSSNNALAFKYNLVDFYIKEDSLVDKDQKKFFEVIKDYQLTGKLPADYSGLESNNLENLNEDGLSKEIAGVLKNASEGSFSQAINLNGYLHTFYVQKKDLVESQEFTKAKEQIQNEIFTEKGKSVSMHWFDREYSNYYIKNLL
jgi:peptidyl-prolyl cis-trans isomerase SurA